MNFSTKGKEIKSTETISKWLTPLTTNIVKLYSAEYVTSNGGTPGMKMTFVGKPVEGLSYELDGKNVNFQRVESTNWLSDSAYKYTEATMITLADVMGIREEFDNAMDSANTKEDVVNIVNTMFTNKAFSMNVFGEEIAIKGDDGETNIWTKPSVPFFLKGNVDSLENFGFLEENLEKRKAKSDLIKRVETSSTTETITTDLTSTEELGW